jgi:lipopolysaccharide/colanic/teichoic acid biosynthesis glycosyltransferase
VSLHIDRSAPASEHSRGFSVYRLAKRALDIAGSLVALVVLSPVLAITAVAIRFCSPGPFLYPARRAGLKGEPFVMHKFRTMHHAPAATGPAITAADDPRVFPLGSFLRRVKIDELPQFYDILRGKMSFVGPRPEDPRIVEEHYTEEQRETLAVPPGLTSPGTLFYYTHGERCLDTDDPEAAYAADLLPLKLSLDLEYARNASLVYDLRLILETAWIILQIALGRRSFPPPASLTHAPTDRSSGRSLP